MGLEQFDDGVRSVTQPAARPSPLAAFDDAAHAGPAEVARESRIYNGLYTLTFPDGSHNTFRVYTKKPDAKFAPGKRLIARLIGPDVESFDEYENFGFVGDDGITVWKNKRGGEKNPSKLAQYAGIIWMLATGEALEGYELLVSRRCLRCNHTLTDPESIERGVGPTCFGRGD